MSAATTGSGAASATLRTASWSCPATFMRPRTAKCGPSKSRSASRKLGLLDASVVAGRRLPDHESHRATLSLVRRRARRDSSLKEHVSDSVFPSESRVVFIGVASPNQVNQSEVEERSDDLMKFKLLFEEETPGMAGTDDLVDYATQHGSWRSSMLGALSFSYRSRAAC